MRKRHLAAVMALVLTPWVSGSAQQFPADEVYRPWPCNIGGVIGAMTDPFQDESGATLERDLVGDTGAPAGLRAADPDFLFLRLRVDSAPVTDGTPRPFAWGLLVDTDGDASTYEVMLVGDGGAGTVSIHQNTSGLPGDLRDPPESQAAVQAWDARARSVTAPGSGFGGTADHFVDLAFSWSDLASVGIGPTTPVRVWAATSTGAAIGMNGDFACQSGGPPAVDSTWPETVADPWRDSDSDGFSDATEVENGTDPGAAGSHPAGGGDIPRLAGGGGCQHGTAGLLAFAGLLVLALRVRRRSPPAR
jgi:uncharacterized protein (TIGR03382 family)